MPVLKTNILKRRAPKQLWEMGKDSGISQTMATSSLEILENSLQKDGILNLSDYETLKKKALDLMSNFNPATQTGRNAIASFNKKVSDYDLAQTKMQQESGDLNQIDFNVKDILKSIELRTGNNANNFLNQKAELFNTAINDLSLKLVNAERTGNFKEANKFINAIDEYQTKYDETISLLGAISNVAENGKVENVATFVKTDGQGRVTGIDYKIPYQGELEGFVPSNAYLDGVQIYLKPIRRADGINYSVLNGKVFDDSKGDLFQQALTGETNRNKPLMYGLDDVQIKSEELKMKGHISKNEFGRSLDGTLYKNIGNGQFIKFKNADVSDFNLSPTEYQDINSAWEQRTNPLVIDTIDLKSSDTLRQIEKYKSPETKPMMSYLGEGDRIQKDLMRLKTSLPKTTAPSAPAVEPQRNLWERAKGYFSGLNPFTKKTPQQETIKPTQGSIDASFLDLIPK